MGLRRREEAGGTIEGGQKQGRAGVAWREGQVRADCSVETQTLYACSRQHRPGNSTAHMRQREEV